MKAVKEKKKPSIVELINSKRVLTLEEAAEYLSISPWSIRKLIREGKLPGLNIGVRRVLIDKADIDFLIDRNKTRELF